MVADKRYLPFVKLHNMYVDNDSLTSSRRPRTSDLFTPATYGFAITGTKYKYAQRHSVNRWCIYQHIGAQTKWPPFRRRYFTCIFLNQQFSISIRISPKFVPNDPFHNKSALAQVMAWRRTGDIPLPEPMLTQFTDAYMWLYELIVLFVAVPERNIL